VKQTNIVPAGRQNSDRCISDKNVVTLAVSLETNDKSNICEPWDFSAYFIANTKLNKILNSIIMSKKVRVNEL
jgi:hypothetical protein